MAYYRSNSPIIGYSGHIPGEKWHVGSRARGTASEHNLSDSFRDGLIISKNNHHSHGNPPIRERTEDTTTTEVASITTDGSHSYDWEGNPVRKNRSLSQNKTHNRNHEYYNNNESVTKFQQSKNYPYNIKFKRLEQRINLTSQQQSKINNTNSDSLKRINHHSYHNKQINGNDNRTYDQNVQKNNADFLSVETPYPLQPIRISQPNMQGYNTKNFKTDSQHKYYEQYNNIKPESNIRNNQIKEKEIDYESEEDEIKSLKNVKNVEKNKTNEQQLIKENASNEEKNTNFNKTKNSVDFDEPEIPKKLCINQIDENDYEGRESANEYVNEQTDRQSIINKNIPNLKFNNQQPNKIVSTCNEYLKNSDSSLRKHENKKHEKSINRQGGGVSQYHRNCCCRQTKQTNHRNHVSDGSDDSDDQTEIYSEDSAWTEGQALKNLRAYKLSIGAPDIIDRTSEDIEEPIIESKNELNNYYKNQDIPAPGYSGHIPEIYRLSIGKPFTVAAKESFKLHHHSYRENNSNHFSNTNQINNNKNNQSKIMQQKFLQTTGDLPQQQFTSRRCASRETNPLNQRSPY